MIRLPFGRFAMLPHALFVAAISYLWLAPRPVGAETSTTAPPPAAASVGCVDKSAVALIGDWDAVVAGGTVIGRDVLTSRLHGCAIEEQWTGARGMHGTSLTALDPAGPRWRQFWVDDSGTVAALEGGFDGGALVLEGASNQASGKTTHVRGTWRPTGCSAEKTECSVHVLWEAQDAQSKAWSRLYEFDLRRHE